MRITLIIALAIGMAGPAFAAMTTFDFEAAPLGLSGDSNTGANGAAAGAYMTGVMGSTVTVTDAAVWSNAQSGADWSGNNGKWLRTFGLGSSGAEMTIRFDTAIWGVQFDGYVFDATSGTDIGLDWYDINDNLIANDHQSGISNGTPVAFNHTFGQAVYRLDLHDSGYYDVGMDNLKPVFYSR